MLVLDSVAKKKLRTIKAVAEQFPLPSEILALTLAISPETQARVRDLRAFIDNCTVSLETNYRVTYTVEEQPEGLVRHLMIGVDGGQPEKLAIRLLTDELHFTNPLWKCRMWEEEFGKKDILVHVTEPLVIAIPTQQPIPAVA